MKKNEKLTAEPIEDEKLLAKKEKLLKEIAAHSAVCQHDGCPRHEHCMLWLAGRYVNKNMRIIRSINTQFSLVANGNCDLYCDDPMMSKQHFAIEIQGDQLNIMDLGSRNGTSLNGSRLIDQQRLENHDEIHAGNLKFTVEW